MIFGKNKGGPWFDGTFKKYSAFLRDWRRVKS
jgi:hypothetical protein